MLAVALILSQVGWSHNIPTYSYTPPPPNITLPTSLLFNTNGSTRNFGHRSGRGSYQLADGSWRKAKKLVFDGEQITVKDSLVGKLKFTAQTVKQLEVGKDTFLVMSNLPGREVAVEKHDFVQSCVNRKGIRLLALYADYGQVAYFLSRPGRTLQLLPKDRKVFKSVMTEIVKDNPGLAAKIATGKLGPDDVVTIVQQYTEPELRPGSITK